MYGLTIRGTGSSREGTDCESLSVITEPRCLQQETGRSEGCCFTRLRKFFAFDPSVRDAPWHLVGIRRPYRVRHEILLRRDICSHTPGAARSGRHRRSVGPGRHVPAARQLHPTAQKCDAARDSDWPFFLRYSATVACRRILGRIRAFRVLQPFGHTAGANRQAHE